MEVHPLSSSVLSAVAYDGDTQLLEVRFQTGRIYRYRDIPREIFEPLLTAPSAGQYFNTHIRDRYRAELIFDPKE
jgi:lysyl-tRNA synthetase, class II